MMTWTSSSTVVIGLKENQKVPVKKKTPSYFKENSPEV
jgi:hypothetical protein